eukprot:scaffold2161_cov244-Pinguiococcus_pyrenoidosus.AAC.6
MRGGEGKLWISVALYTVAPLAVFYVRSHFADEVAMRHLKVPVASHLVVVLPSRLHNVLPIRARDAHLAQHRRELLLSEVAEGTSVRLPGQRRRALDDLHAPIRGVVGALSLLTVHVPPTVRVALLVVRGGHDLRVLHLEEPVRVLQREPRALEEEAVLHAALMLQLVVAAQALVQVPHAQGHGSAREAVDVLRRNAIGTGSILQSIAAADVLLVDVVHERSDPRIGRGIPEAAGAHCHAAAEHGPEPGGDDTDEHLQGHVGLATLEKDAAPRDFLKRLRERQLKVLHLLEGDAAS